MRLSRSGLALGVGVALVALVACSDDGVSPEAFATSGDQGLGEGSGSTGSVSTTATVSAGNDLDGTGTAGDGESGAADDDAPLDSSGGAPTSTSGGDDGTSGGLSSGDDGSTGAPPPPGTSCDSDRDCVVVNDCCTCGAAHVDEDLERCPELCEAPMCDGIGIGEPTAQCVLGVCELVPVTCDPWLAFCEQRPPDCAEGSLPAVNGETNCWTGQCVPGEACDVVPDCSWCPEDEACVVHENLQGPTYSCWPTPPGCDGTPTCACMGEVCVDPFQCADAAGGDADLNCFCPVC